MTATHWTELLTADAADTLSEAFAHQLANDAAAITDYTAYAAFHARAYGMTPQDFDAAKVRNATCALPPHVEREAIFHPRHRTRQRAPLKAREEYYLSTTWLALRAEAIEAAGRRCQLCNSPDFLEVHHRTYARLFCERLSDLTVLCGACHRMFHRHRYLHV